MKVNYSLYLVTDNTDAILRGRDLVQIVKEAVEGGVTIVQLRDKTSETAELIRIAKALHKVTKAHDIPLLINDRVDVALAAGVDGVHIGQDDIDLASARKILGKDAIIGVTANSVEEAKIAAEGGADYLGLGTVYATPTKQNSKSIIGPSGVRHILSELHAANLGHVQTVCIGGINASNAQRVLYQAASPVKSLDGIAVVSAIIGAEDPKKASADLLSSIHSSPPFAHAQEEPPIYFDHPMRFEYGDLQFLLSDYLKELNETAPLCHNMTNQVVQNFAANVALCVGASPIMSGNGLEAADLAKLGGSLVINMGTVTPEGLSNYLQALRAYNAVGGPVVFDPVGAGATEQRRNAVKTLMNGGYIDLIKGNEGEIKTVAGVAGAQQRGVDSGPSAMTLEDKAELVQQLAKRERNVVLMTGTVDVLSDGERTFAIHNGHEFLGKITGSGCTLGTTIASFLAVSRGQKFSAALTAILTYEIAAERAAERPDVKGPGTFVPAFLDELWLCAQEMISRNWKWVERAKVRDLTRT
ncbi:Hydroxyethylthiazole kinase [Saccharata proteae CBS 121410]|uniref:Hydroxyethylthiazole kinase n=1 Tax=Saccharata proteae CBS 121410 TaxID=1314787 RepID=A0A9P4HTW9_9PEZI|nr:Hydroxyethylthiazole kinase [Saccharata proteae CBS 121410]